MISPTIPASELRKLYTTQRLSAHQIALRYKCSDNKINYWLKRHHIDKRSISNALYQRLNPMGDPFQFKKPTTLDSAFLMGLGLGLYWGEGTKRNKSSVRLGNTDPGLIKAFLLFLIRTYSIKEEKLRFGLQIFSDMKPSDALRFWTRELGVSAKQFGKVIVTPARSIGTYREKTRHGVLTVYFSNRKLRDALCGKIEELAHLS